MSVRSCRVTIRDMDGVEHTVQVTASSLYEAVALGLASFRAEEWVGGIPEGLHLVRVCVTTVPVEHTVTVADFHGEILARRQQLILPKGLGIAERSGEDSNARAWRFLGRKNLKTT